MRKISLVFGLMVLTLLLALAIPATFAKVMTGDAPTVGPDEVIDDDLFLAGQEVVIEGTVNGDVYAAGQTVTVKGTVNGDVLAAAENVYISGRVRDDVRVAGQNVRLSRAEVGDSLTAAGQTVTAEGDSSIGGGVLAAAQLITLKAPVGRGIMGAAESITLSAKVGRDVNLAVERLRLESTAELTGKLSYRSDRDAQIDQGAKLGEIQRTAPPQKDQAAGRRFGLAFRLWSLAAALVIGFLLLRFLPKPTLAVPAAIQARPWQALGWGFLTLILVGPVLLLLAVTLIGIPLALIALGLFLLELYLVKIFIGVVLGNLAGDWMNLKERNNYMTLAIGLVLYYILKFIPIIGAIATLAAVLFGLGGILLAKRDYLKATSKQT